MSHRSRLRRDCGERWESGSKNGREHRSGLTRNGHPSRRLALQTGPILTVFGRYCATIDLSNNGNSKSNPPSKHANATIFFLPGRIPNLHLDLLPNPGF